MSKRPIIQAIRRRSSRIARASISRVLRRIEKRLPLAHEAQAPVFIIGAPRTGSTVLYQALTNAYDFSYIDNLTCRWHRNLLFGAWVSQRRFGNVPHDNFLADHGATDRYGMHAPSECGEFWYRWLPRDRHYVSDADLSPQMVEEIRAALSCVSQLTGRPVLIKNLNAGQRLALLAESFPDAKIIFLQRDPRFVLTSILEARRALHIPDHQMWSVRPPSFDTLLHFPVDRMCLEQICAVEAQIEQDLERFPAKNVRRILYHDLSGDLLAELATWIGVTARPNGALPEFRKDDPTRLSEEVKTLWNTWGSIYPVSQRALL